MKKGCECFSMNQKNIFAKQFVTLLAFLLLFSYASLCAAEVTVDLSPLTVSELNTFIDDINRDIEQYHEPDYVMNDTILSVVKNEVESHFNSQGIEISWAWVHYDYTREWDFYTLTTHIDYNDANGKHIKPDVYAELFPNKGQYSVYYLLIGTEVVINRRTELPDKLWVKTPAGVINKSTGLDLSTMNVQALNTLKSMIVDEVSANHTPSTTISDLVLSLTKIDVEQYFSEKGIEISWAWINYTYTCDWGFYTLKTHIDYWDAAGDKQKPDVYAEAYPDAGKYSLYYLTVGDQILIDRRDQLPKNMSAVIETEQATATPKPTNASDSTPVPTNTPTPASTPVTTPVAEQDTSDSYTYSGPAYEIIDSHSTGIGLTQYWVYTGKFNYKTDAFREQVKAIIRDVVFKENDEKIIVDVVTDKEIVYFESDNTIQAYLDKYGMDYFTTQIAPKEETDWVAEYRGGYDANTSKLSDEDAAFEIFWVYADYTDREDLVFEQWKPSDIDPYILLQKNSKGEAVFALQERLKVLGYYTVDATGTFDKNTISAMKSFEKANGLKADGNASVDDQAFIFSENAAPKPTPTPKPTKKPTPTPKPTKTPDPRKAYGTFNFKDASKYPDKYVGTQVKITGKVLQVLGNMSDGFQLRVASKGNYDNVVYIIVPNATEYILEDDKINFYCFLSGNTSYETIFGSEVTLPLLYCDFYEYR